MAAGHWSSVEKEVLFKRGFVNMSAAATIIARMRAKTAQLCAVNHDTPPTTKHDSKIVIVVLPKREPKRVPENAMRFSTFLESHGHRGRQHKKGFSRKKAAQAKRAF